MESLKGQKGRAFPSRQSELENRKGAARMETAKKLKLKMSFPKQMWGRITILKDAAPGDNSAKQTSCLTTTISLIFTLLTYRKFTIAGH